MATTAVPTALPVPQKKDRGRIAALDGLRGIAILLVLLFHFPAPLRWMRPLASMGWVGVDLFFALSGYLITGILLSSKNSPHYFRNFYARRTLRIFPLYYGFLLLYLVLLPLVINPQILGLEHIAGYRLSFWFYYTNYATGCVWPHRSVQRGAGYFYFRFGEGPTGSTER